jgi:hypothetical protein
MDLLPFIVVDNFFKDPDNVRKKALELDFSILSKAPGARALCPPDISELVTKKLLSLLIDVDKSLVEIKINIFFQLTTGKFEKGWVHSDADNLFFAGVIYLTPNAPLDGGTCIYKAKNDTTCLDEMEEFQVIKNKYYTENLNTYQEFRDAREKNNNLFYKTLEISNVYNRLVMYPANEFHSENKLFGTTKDDARLTLVFFVSHIASNSLLPVDRMKLVEKN